MNRYKTNDIECKIKIRVLGKSAYFEIWTGGRVETINIPSEIIKKQFSDAAFVKHVLGFFIKD